MTEEIAQELSTLNIFDISLSIYGAREKTHDAITGQTGSFQKTLQSISILKKHNLSIRLKYIMMKDNMADYKAMLDLSQQLNIPYDLDPIITPRDDGNMAPTELRLSDKNLKIIYRNSF